MRQTLIKLLILYSCISGAYVLTSYMDKNAEEKKAELGQKKETEKARIISPYEFQQLRKECKKKPECYSQKVWELEHKKIDYI